MLMVMFVLEEAECFLGTELSDAGEILHTEAIQNISSFQLAYAETQRARYGLRRYGFVLAGECWR